MDREFIYRLLIYISAFGISDNVLERFKVSTEKRIILYSILFFFTYMLLRPPTHPVDQGSTEK